MARRVLSLWLSRLAVDRLARRKPALREVPLVTILGDRGRMIVVAVNAVAESAGVQPGATLADARALEPSVTPIDADFAADALALDGLADWCGRYTPWVGLDAPDGLFLDVTGCGHLFGGEAALLDDIVARLKAFGYQAKAAVADTAGAAWGMARHVRDPIVAVPPGQGRQALAGLPVEALRLPPDTAAGLRRLGMRRVGDLYGMPRAGITTRFGVIVTRMLDLALGVAPEPISPRRPVTPHVARAAFAEPISTPENLTTATLHLLDELCAGLERAGRGARRLELRFFRVDGRVERSIVGTSRPVRAAGHLARLFAGKLDRVEPGPGVEIMILSATAEPLAASQVEMPVGDAAPTLAGTHEEGELVDRLGNRFGLIRVQRLLPRESWWPENAVEAVPALSPPTSPPSTAAAIWPADRTRPLRLLARPEPIDVIAPVPDDPPLSFRWRGVAHKVVHAEGPERLEPEWWRELNELRDYYRVEDTEGQRFWVYRAGLYQPGRTARWYLHGVFP
ncbi:protein imuB [Skermanella stibiiresistens SB22]|uniref:Protein imuB n=1 Tax=Skermanella stibiiresistens SB22 TaxID=1385369 RepID=W9H5T7_9PROT|nr:DNA polymerase Y family protein [Skermanella stibiiresistens]EWY40072.1 protein imuB [Skermanella stibiiresistens SB22]